MSSVIDDYNYFVFDVDRTIAPNNGAISPSIIGRLRTLIEHVNIVIVTSRGIHEGLELMAHAFFQNKSNYSLYFFPTSGTQGYLYDSMTGGLLKLYDKAKGDPHFQAFHQNFRQLLADNQIEVVADVKFDPAEKERQVQIHDRTSQVTLFFSYGKLREEFIALIKDWGVHCLRHGLNTIHILPSGIDKRLAIDYLAKEDSDRFLIFADGFYSSPKEGNHGNDLSFVELPSELVTCIHVGHHMPKPGCGVFYDATRAVFEDALTDSLLKKIVSGCSFDDLCLTQCL